MKEDERTQITGPILTMKRRKDEQRPVFLRFYETFVGNNTNSPWTR